MGNVWVAVNAADLATDEPSQSLVSITATPSAADETFHSAEFRFEDQIVNQPAPARTPGKGSKMTRPSTQLLPYGHEQPSPNVLKSSLDLLDHTTELIATCLSSTPHAFWQTLEQSPWTSLESVRVSAQVFRKKHVIGALTSGANASGDRLKQEISTDISTCTRLGTSKDSGPFKVSLCPVVVYIRWRLV